MRTKTLAILAAAIVVSAGATLVLRARDKAPVADAAGQLVFPNLTQRIDGVARIEIERNGDKFELVRAGDGAWTMPAKGGYPADFQQIRKVALETAGLRIVEARTANPALHAEIDLDGAGKDQKAVRVTLSGAQGETFASLLVGR